METVDNSWKLPAEGIPIKMFYIKMKRLKLVLKEFNKTHFGGTSIRVADKKKELEVIQRQILTDDMVNNKADDECLFSH
ncbi:hypothetical protein DITRI_Ditri03aG0011600 [Diplodiscus trichospermus]